MRISETEPERILIVPKPVPVEPAQPSKTQPANDPGEEQQEEKKRAA